MTEPMAATEPIATGAMTYGAPAVISSGMTYGAPPVSAGIRSGATVSYGVPSGVSYGSSGMVAYGGGGTVVRSGAVYGSGGVATSFSGQRSSGISAFDMIDR